MLQMAFSPAGRLACALLAAIGLFGAGWWQGASTERAGWKTRLASDRITILKDGKAIDDEIDHASDADLCRLLGGC